MNKIYYIISFIFLLTPLLYGADGIAIPAHGAELTLSPDWERDADARIWSDRVVKDFKSGSSAGFKINAICDESALNEIKEIKKLSLEIIKNDIFSQTGTSQGSLALKIFERGNEYLPVSDAAAESRVIARFESLPQRERPHGAAGFSGSPYPEAPGFLCASFAGVTVNTGKPELKKPPLSSGRAKACHHIFKSPLNLSLLWDREKADYYRIFLYLRDDDRIRKLSNIIFPSPSLSLPFNSYFSRLKIKTKLLLTTNLNTLPDQSINSQGALS